MIEIIFRYIFIILFFIITIYGKDITLNAIAYSLYEDDKIYPSVIDDFNEYSKKNNLGIKINLIVSAIKSSTENESYGSMVESLLKKKKINMIYTFMIMLILKHMDHIY
ncbi:hypothetical protein H8356DRAFT_581582 [Neocallimastix lanati (nom. inval.)]|uniref:Uncharacterized protein n=1 Tax=Neocallimastix californiae TaxID=1754190 RepID=A0A1Y2BA07_9FUNG|nr:hypothetical protein H8356DRAFT_581582 [Neocallimastix sp. JGI-2020a]ORY31688.1 hypothetical protein LY90DRAFT_76394 [Neocallimastix californiae]|eukprot:ORY31688.1 hypothetical protein LY90DRAFT_76394 [Neocallimastix californiae]